jgi:hypothetical protein
VSTARAFFETELRFQVEKAIDAHVIAKLMAATPPNGTTGTGLPAQVRHAVAAMRSAGTNPDLLVVDPTDAVALDLYTDGSGALVFGVRARVPHRLCGVFG